MEIRSYRPADAAAISTLHNKISPDQPVTWDSFDGRLQGIMVNDGLVRVLLSERQIVGYAAASPVPGLDRVLSLEGAIDPAKRRQGLGSHLLRHLLHELKQSRVRQLSCCLTNLDDPAAHFLRAHRFYIEHEEWLMEHSHLDALPALPNVDVRNFPRSETINLFCALYDQSFADHPWYQPYTFAEVDAVLDSPADLQFLVVEGLPIGFVWTRLANERVGEIEPIGVARNHQGTGYGRFLLLVGLHRLKELGAIKASVGTWRQNQAAIQLYRSLGFRHQQTLTYLALDL